ncbi:MAG: ParB N-terminal domain-containing protein [Pseudomonadota bacterium]
MMERHELPIAEIYVPTKRQRTLEAAKVEALAEDMLEHGQKTPIQCRWDKKTTPPRLVLVEGYHRLEALRALGETTVTGYVVQARIR